MPSIIIFYVTWFLVRNFLSFTYYPVIRLLIFSQSPYLLHDILLYCPRLDLVGMCWRANLIAFDSYSYIPLSVYYYFILIILFLSVCYYYILMTLLLECNMYALTL
ncbi:hypothetical protein Lalb_Chr12g0207531 [Lupinus albus]|uniref:Uncharacterized protein n=1 Tax=Lupinus albus TaxID=3870 RepID=A0A6A4PNV5_LUPAL|nr:hypothetical protein Lalb_Chr12g0207531 [Lupinus albus]